MVNSRIYSGELLARKPTAVASCDYYLYLASLVHQTLKHFLWCCKLVCIPGEVAFPICVLNVKPNEVIWDVMLIKACIH